MLNAKEARKIAAASHANVERILESLDGKIRAAAESGKPSLVIDEPDTFQFRDESLPAPELTPLQLRLITRLHELGYKTESVQETPRVVMGAMDDTPKSVKHSIYIRW